MKLFRLFKDHPQDVDDLKIWIKNLYGLSVYPDKIIANDNLVRFLLCIFFLRKLMMKFLFWFLVQLFVFMDFLRTLCLCIRKIGILFFLSKDVDIVLFIV